MMMKVDGGYIFVKASREEEAVIKTWKMMSKDKQKGWWYGRISLQLLDKLYHNGGLIPAAKKEMERLAYIQEAVDRERVNPEPAPFYKYPVKMPLYAHQVRGANMAMLTFGWMAPKGGVANG